jgi:hypothetical protein
MSTTVLPGVRPAAMPSGSNKALFTSGVSGTMTMTSSACCATAFSVSHAVAPASRMSAGTERLA